MNRQASAGVCLEFLGGDRAIARAYLLAKAYVMECGYEGEISWQEDACMMKVTGTIFVREAAWVIFCSGMSEAVVRKKFGDLARAFEYWSPGRICNHQRTCQQQALSVFNHRRKVSAVVEVAKMVDTFGVERLLYGIQTEGPGFLTELPYVGEVTCFHLAKNLGYAVSKPDRHLTRIAATLGYEQAAALCERLSSTVGDSVQVIDIVLWRFATLRSDYRWWFQQACSATQAR